MDVDLINIDDNRTPEQYFADLIVERNSSTTQHDYVSIDGHLALKSHEPAVPFESYDIIVPVVGEGYRRVYTVSFSDIGEDMNAPYDIRDPFIQHEFAKLHAMILTVKFME